MSQGLASRTTASAQGTDAIRVLVVDDSSVIRGIVSRWIEAAAETTLFGSAVNGQDALERVKTDKPDIIVLDIEMPGMDGITALPLLLKACPQAKIIMASTLTRRNAEISLKALALGAADYVPKPTSLGGGEAAEDFRRELFARITALGGKRLRRAPAPAPRPVSTAEVAPRAAIPPVSPGVAPASRVETPAAPVKPAALPIRAPHAPVSNDDATVPARAAIQLRKSALLPPQVLVIGSSTGGPQALVAVITAIAPQLNVPVLITQHMPPTFTSILAESLSRVSGLKCVEGANGMMLERGCVYVAPGDYHMVIKGKGGPIELNQNAPENFCRPAVDPLFRSVAAAYGASALAVVLTGMGSDGREGSRSIVGAGGTVIAQDEETSVVWGMPGAVAQAGLAAAVLPLNSVGTEIRKHLGLRPK
jgi:two-component system, chemotaxis family, protein-glutamate methylesterase/glutaminase